MFYSNYDCADAIVDLYLDLFDERLDIRDVESDIVNDDFGGYIEDLTGFEEAGEVLAYLGE